MKTLKYAVLALVAIGCAGCGQSAGRKYVSSHNCTLQHHYDQFVAWSIFTNRPTTYSGFSTYICADPHIEIDVQDEVKK